MKLIYSRRALADLGRIATYYGANASPAVAQAIGLRLEAVIERIYRSPGGRSPPVPALQRPRCCGGSLSIQDFLPAAR
jgi:plasmid stabilization system protein ParE